MESILIVYKRIGETPLEALERVRLDKHIPSEVPMTYAGRLDPMAEGVMIILVGDACEENNKKKYLGFDKTYELEILVGFSTDTHDLLGLVQNMKTDVDQKEILEKVQNEMQTWIGEFEQTYPLYSSKTVSGKQLFTYGQSGEAVKLPNHLVRVYSLSYMSSRSITSEVLETYLDENIGKVLGDFRQSEIVQTWHEKLQSMQKKEFLVVKLEVVCGSGMYVRQLVHDIGKNIGIPMLMFSLKRTRVGEYSLKNTSMF
jgi:tRNA pseudouridine55 synthase